MDEHEKLLTDAVNGLDAAMCALAALIDFRMQFTPEDTQRTAQAMAVIAHMTSLVANVGDALASDPSPTDPRDSGLIATFH